MGNKKINLPSGITIEYEKDNRFVSVFNNPTVVEDIKVELKENGGLLSVNITAQKTAVRRVILHWNEALPEDGCVMCGAWERGYGDLEWRHYVPERILPWYFLVQSGQKTLALGVRVRPNAMCFWTAESQGYSLYLDTRCGGTGVLLGGRTLHAADICKAEYGDSDGYSAQQEFCKIMCSDPLLPKEPIFGANNWYHSYGNDTAEDILDQVKELCELTQELDVRPWFLIDEGWEKSAHTIPGYMGGPWREGNVNFPDMALLAERINSMGAKAGIWIRPLFDNSCPKEWLLPTGKLDPSIPEVIERVKEDFRTLSNWGYKLIKHDFTTFDMFGKWGFEMDGGDLTAYDWHFADQSRTSAEIIIDLYRNILDGAGDSMILGCNCIGHLAAGLIHINRAGDDTSGNIWSRTRRMGINTLAFTIAQNGGLYAVDADCVPLTDRVDQKLTERWLELVAKSGTVLFASFSPSVLDDSRRLKLKEAYRIAATNRTLARPLDWRYTTCPMRWSFFDGEKEFDWSEPFGIRPERYLI